MYLLLYWASGMCVYKTGELTCVHVEYETLLNAKTADGKQKIVSSGLESVEDE
jgi:hypothetical protein